MGDAGKRRFRAGLVQMCSTTNPKQNIDAAAKLIRDAVAGGAEYVLTPEMTNIMITGRELLAAIAPEEEDSSLIALRELARQCRVFLHAGSLAVKVSAEKAANRSFLIDPGGDIVARYDKIHMFDTGDVGAGETYRESRNYRGGELAVMSDVPWGRLGLTICYDLRFPALYRALAERGAGFFSIPSAFTKPTGEAHWHVLVRARAIENGCFVFAAAQAGKHESGRETYGHSLVVDPWGRVLAEAGREPMVIVAEIDPAEVATARERIPSLQHGRRFEILEPGRTATHLHLVGDPA